MCKRSANREDAESSFRMFTQTVWLSTEGCPPGAVHRGLSIAGYSPSTVYLWLSTIDSPPPTIHLLQSTSRCSPPPPDPFNSPSASVKRLYLTVSLFKFCSRCSIVKRFYFFNSRNYPPPPRRNQSTKLIWPSRRLIASPRSQARNVLRHL